MVQHGAASARPQRRFPASVPGRWLIAIETLGELDLEAMGFWPGRMAWHRSMAAWHGISGRGKELRGGIKSNLSVPGVNDRRRN